MTGEDVFTLRPIAALDAAGLRERIEICPAGQYFRRPPFQVDLQDASAATAETVRLHAGVLTQPYPQVAILALPDATLCGQGSVMTCAGELVRESVAEFVAHGLVPDGMRLQDGLYAPTAPVSREIEATCLLVKRPWYRNYGHFLVDAAPILAIAAEHVDIADVTLVLGACESDAMRRVMTDMIARLLPGAKLLFHPDGETWRFRHLLYPSPVHVPPLFKLPYGLRRLRDRLRTRPAVPGTRDLFVSRLGSAALSRRLLNEDELLGLCHRRGFQLVTPETLSLAAQVELFADARMIVGVKGAALTNAIFSSPGTAMVVLSPSDFPDPFFWDIAGQSHIHYGEIFGPIAVDGVLRDAQGQGQGQGQHSFTIAKTKLSDMLDAAGQLVGR